jgi:hypothetical protein
VFYLMILGQPICLKLAMSMSPGKPGPQNDVHDSVLGGPRYMEGA